VGRRAVRPARGPAGAVIGTITITVRYFESPVPVITPVTGQLHAAGAVAVGSTFTFTEDTTARDDTWTADGSALTASCP